MKKSQEMNTIRDRASKNNSPSGRRVLIVGADGLRPDQVRPETMPTYCRLMKNGTFFNSFYSAYPSLTRVCVATLTTGCYPGRHGLMGNLMYAPLFSGDGLLQTGDHQQIMQFQAQTGEPLLLCPTLGDRLAKANMRLTVSAGSSPGASLIWNFHHPQWVVNPATDYNIPDLSRLHAIRGPLPAESDTSIKKKERTLWAVQTLIDMQLPDPQNTCMLLWLPEPDETQHYFGVGSHQTRQAQGFVDRCLSEIMAAVCRLGLEDELDVLLVSDHGHSTARMAGSLEDHIRQARKELKKELNFIAVESFLYGDEQNEDLEVLAQWLSAQTWCGMLLAKDSLQHRLKDSLPLSAVIGKVAHERAPLLAVVPAWTNELNKDGIQGAVHYLTSKTFNQSYHGSILNDDMRAFCLGYGPSFKQGYATDIPAGIVDIAPTVCCLLGMSKESGFSGRVLFEAMNDCEERAVNRENVRYTEYYGNSDHSKGIRVAEVNETSYIADCFCGNTGKSL